MGKNLILAFLVFYPMAAALVGYVVGRKSKKARDYFADFVVITEFLAALYAGFGTGQLSFSIDQFAGFGIHFTMDGFRSVYICVAAVMWMVTTIFSREYFKHYHNRNRYYMFLLLTLGATMGVFLSADLYTTYIFFEIMSLTSYVWVAHDEKKESLRAAETYLAVAIIGGMVMLMGLFLLHYLLGTLQISELLSLAKVCEKKEMLFAAGICISVGFAAKAGAFPLHIWLPKAHPVAPAPASALLSGMLTKTGIFGLLIMSCQLFYGNTDWGRAILLFGVVTMFGGAVLALFSVNIKRTLACSSVSQIGFILIGIGMMGMSVTENALAARGTLLHMVNHSLIKLILFVAAGVIFMNIHELNLNEIRGFGRKKPFLKFVFLMGALGIGGIPLWNGYVSKTLLHESIVEHGGLKLIEWIFLISGGITIAYMTKLFVAVFVEKNIDVEKQKEFDERKTYMNKASAAAIGLSTLLLPVMGFFPGLVMDPLAEKGISLMNASELTHSVHYFNGENLKGAMVSILIGIALYFFIVRPLLMKKTENGCIYVDRWPSWVDLEDYLYRPILIAVCAVAGFFFRICDSLVDALVVLLRKTIYADRELPFELTEGNMFTYYMGKFLNVCEDLIEKKFPRWKHKHHEFVHELAMLDLEYQETKNVISRTLSFGFLLFSTGFLLTTIYLLSIYW